jgi:hypothetical protein
MAKGGPMGSVRVNGFMSAVVLSSLLSGVSPVPAISSFIPLNAQTSSSSTVTFFGVEFGVSDSSPSAYLAGQLCETTAWTLATTLVCIANVVRLQGGTFICVRVIVLLFGFTERALQVRSRRHG